MNKDKINEFIKKTDLILSELDYKKAEKAYIDLISKLEKFFKESFDNGEKRYEDCMPSRRIYTGGVSDKLMSEYLSNDLKHIKTYLLKFEKELEHQKELALTKLLQHKEDVKPQDKPAKIKKTPIKIKDIPLKIKEITRHKEKVEKKEPDTKKETIDTLRDENKELKKENQELKRKIQELSEKK